MTFFVKSRINLKKKKHSQRKYEYSLNLNESKKKSIYNLRVEFR